MATIAVGAGSRAARSNLIASAQCSSTLRHARRSRAERRLEAAVDLDRVHVSRGRGASRSVSTPSPAADLEHDVAGLEVGVADDRVEQVRVGEEVLAEP